MRLAVVLSALALTGCMAHQMNTAWDEPEKEICRGTAPAVWRCVYERLLEDEARPVRTCAEVDAAIAACEKEGVSRGEHHPHSAGDDRIDHDANALEPDFHPLAAQPFGQPR